MAANGMTTAEANRVLDDSINASTVDLATTMGTASTGPTPVAGGSYTPQTPTYAAASGATKHNSATVTYSGLPDTTGVGGVKGIDLKNTSGADRRWFTPFASPIITALGDSIAFAATTGMVFSLVNGT